MKNLRGIFGNVTCLYVFVGIWKPLIWARRLLSVRNSNTKQRSAKIEKLYIYPKPSKTRCNKARCTLRAQLCCSMSSGLYTYHPPSARPTCQKSPRATWSPRAVASAKLLVSVRIPMMPVEPARDQFLLFAIFA